MEEWKLSVEGLNCTTRFASSSTAAAAVAATPPPSSTQCEEPSLSGLQYCCLQNFSSGEPCRRLDIIAIITLYPFVMYMLYWVGLQPDTVEKLQERRVIAPFQKTELNRNKEWGKSKIQCGSKMYEKLMRIKSGEEHFVFSCRVPRVRGGGGG